jgi:hypothetical protein
MPDSFTVPDEAGWRLRYPRVARDAPGTMPSFDDAVSLVAGLLDPVLAGRVSGSWDPRALRWS